MYNAGALAWLADGTTVRIRDLGPGAARAVPDDERVAIAAVDLEGQTVGSAGYARVYGPRAEIVLAVGPDFWHRGLPEVLLSHLRDRAARVGISTLLVRVPAGDLALIALLREAFCARETVDGAVVHAEFSTSG